MAAVGSLERDGRTDCSAVLITPKVLVTAAHCVAGRKLVAEGGSFEITFRTGYYPGHRTVERNAVRLMPHPLYLAAKVGKNKPMGVDMALIALEKPVPNDIARPIPIGAPLEEGERVLVASYPAGKGERARERICPVKMAEPTLARISCKIVPGESGAPVIRLGPSGPEIAAIVIASSTESRPPFGLVVQADVRLSQLLAVYGAPLP